MALSFEESKKLFSKQMATAMPMVSAETPMVASLDENAGVMTLDEGSESGMIAAYTEWEKLDVKYEWYEEYTDERVSVVDANKNITVHESQINLSQEENSQYIPFEMPRYYDGIDLTGDGITLYFVYRTNDGGLFDSKAVNVSRDTATIKLGWLVDGNATHVSGPIKFEINAIGVNKYGHPYIWKSKTFDKMTVLQSLQGNKSIELDDSWVAEIVSFVGEEVTKQIVATNVAGQVASATDAADRAEAAAAAAEGAVSNALDNVYTKSEIDAMLDVVEVDLTGYATEEFVKEQIGFIPEVDLTGYATESYVKDQIDLIPEVDLTDYATKTYVEEQIDLIPDVDLSRYALKEDLPINVSELNNDAGYLTEHQSLDGYATKEFVGEAVRAIDVTDQLADYAKSADVYTKGEVDTLLDTVEVDLSNYYTKGEVDEKDTELSDKITANTTDVSDLKKSVTDINSALSGIDKSPRLSYEATYGNVEMDDGSTAEYMFTLWETSGESDPTVKSRFQIMGGGGNTSSVTLRISYVDGYGTPIVATANDKVIVWYEFSGEDSAGDTNLDGTASWKVGNRVVATQEVSTGVRDFDLTDYVNVGDNKVVLTITHATGAIATKAWTVKVVDVRLSSNFDDTKPNTANAAVPFSFTPYGSVDKTIHFLLDGKEIATKTSPAAAAGLSDSYNIPAHGHGTHLFEVYMTAVINEQEIESNHIVKDVIWYDGSSPVIGCMQQEFTARQYEATTITFTVIDPSTETPSVSLKSSYVNESGDVIEEFSSNLVLDSATHEWQFKTDILGEHTLMITCGETVKTLTVTIVELGITVSPVTAGLVFDFNPVGRSNSDENRLWSYGSDIAMTVSDNFDWVNGGYQIDENGDQYFCVKAGTRAEISYELFGDDAKVNGKQMKLVFKTTNVANADTVFLSCVSDTIGTDRIGIEMKAHEATVYAKAEENLPLPYTEDELIEFEINISSSDETPAMVMGYEDGVSTRPMVYDATHDFQQHKDHRVPITIGSDDCDTYIYRFKVYNKSLSDRDILNNFIADARSADEMIARYDRNQIYENGILNPDYLAKVCPQLRIIKIEAPRFTTDKDDKVKGTIIECIYKGGDPILDNWVAYDSVHSGQGTSSNNYGPAGRNLDLIMKTYKDYGNAPYIVLGDGTQTNKISLTRDSVDVNYLNLKVNIASSENANNALLQKRYSEFNPYRRPFVRDSEAEVAKVKDTMEFQNCVVFIRENDPDVSTHVEFADTNWHFYAIGNIGDSKKTDDTRLTDPDDPNECILEVMDNTLPHSTMPTGKVDEHGAPVYPISPSEWTTGNSAYDSLQAETFDEAKATDKANGLADTYGWRYIYEDGTDEENAQYRALAENRWREFYEFVVTATDEEFKAGLGNYCVLDSVLYYYLFTLRYTMTDNHAKNSFWHYGKTGEMTEDGQPVYKWDLCFGYDMDTALGIDNYGRMTYRYGYEEIDFVDGTQDWVWNAPQHVFFMRIRDLFDAELCELYTRLESLNCWSSTSLINQFNEWQNQFPEELWRLDVERKYIRTYTSHYVNGGAKPEFLKERANGRKKYHRAGFERGQEKYMSSKFGGTVASADDIILRCSVPNTTLVVPASFDMHLTPYSHIYLNVKYNTAPPIRMRAVPNVEYTIPYDSELADIIEIYSASCMRSIGDLSACYLINGDFGNASKIRELTLGNSTEGYNNTNSMTLGLGENNLLNKLDIQNMSGLTQSLDLSNLKNLEELYAFGSNVGGVIFADGGNIRIAQIPSVGSLIMKKLPYLTDDGFEIASYDKLTKLVAEQSLLDLVDMINSSANLYQVRLTDINWNLDSTDLLDRLYGLAGVTSTDGNADRAVLSGYVSVPTVKQQQLSNFNHAWPDLVIDAKNVVAQYSATFVNEDGAVLDIQYIDVGKLPVDPLTRENDPIATPTKESTQSHEYTFVGWDKALSPVLDHQVYTAVYKESLRKYVIQYSSMNNVLQTTEADYGSNVLFDGDLPTYTAAEADAYTFYLFDHWDKSGFVDGNKTINAVFDSCSYKDGYFDSIDLADMRPVEVYMLTRLGLSGVLDLSEYIEEKDSINIQLGYDFSYEDVAEEVLVSEKRVFSGTRGDYLDTGIQLLSGNESFVLAIDCKMNSGNSADAVLAQCFSGLDSSGFKLSYNNGAKMTWGSSSVTPFAAGDREMLVLRHIRGENGLHVYSSNTGSMEQYYIELSGIHDMTHDVSLVFGCSKLEDGTYEKYASGTVYWSKLWHADLGHDACAKLACWPRAEMVFEACFEEDGTMKRTYLSDNSGARSSLTFLSAGPLSKPVIMDSGSVDTGGWAEFELNAFLNGRVYNAFPDKWVQLLKSVWVRYLPGEDATEAMRTGCYVFVPSISEIDSGVSDSHYLSEGTHISHLSTDASKICYTEDGVPVQYWTRSPYVATNAANSYVYRIDAGGKSRQVTQLNLGDMYARIMISM